MLRTGLGCTWLDVDAGGLGTCGVHYDVSSGRNDVLYWGYPYEWGWGNRLHTQPGWPAKFSPSNVDISVHNSCAWDSSAGESFCAAEFSSSDLDQVPNIQACEPQNW